MGETMMVTRISVSLEDVNRSCRGAWLQGLQMGAVLLTDGRCFLNVALGFGGGSTGEILLQNQKFFLSLRTRKPLEGS